MKKFGAMNLELPAIIIFLITTENWEKMLIFKLWSKQ